MVDAPHPLVADAPLLSVVDGPLFPMAEKYFC